MHRLPAVVALVAVVALAGCTVYPEPGPRELRGRTDGYTPTAAYLKVFVKDEAGNVTLADFDRRDWYVAKMVDALDAKRAPLLAAHGIEREIPGEVVIDEVLDPADWAGLRYDAMKATTQDREAMDLEYQAILDALALVADPEAPAPSAPTLVTLPTV